MTRTKYFSCICFVAVILILGSTFVVANNIVGHVFDNGKNPVPDVDVELLDDLSRTINRARTDGNGRFEFAGLGDGRFTIRVLPFRYDFDSQEQQIELTSISSVAGQITSITEFRDFYLRPKKGSIADAEAAVVFAQDVPKEAEEFYKNAIANLRKKQTLEGMEGLKKAIELFPNYFLALQRLGREYLGQERFSAAVPILIQATRVNDRSPLSFFSLGYCLHKLGYNKAAVIALKQAAFLSPGSASVFFFLGTSERLEAQFTDAETHLKQAKKLSQSAFPDLHWQLGLLYGENLKRYSDGADEFEQFLEERPGAQDAEKIKAIIKNYRELAKRVK